MNSVPGADGDTGVEHERKREAKEKKPAHVGERKNTGRKLKNAQNSFFTNGAEIGC